MDRFTLNNVVVAKGTNYVFVMIGGDRVVTIIKIRENKDLCVRPTQRGRPVIILQVFAPTQCFLSGGLRFVSETVIKIITVIIKIIFLIIIVRIKIIKNLLSAILLQMM